MNSLLSSTASHALCAICHHAGVEVVVEPCQCQVHSRCIPLDLIMCKDVPVTPVAPGSQACPACQGSKVTRLRLLPLTTEDLDLAGIFRKEGAVEQLAKKTTFSASDEDKRLAEAQSEASYLLISHTGAAGTFSASTLAASLSKDYPRIGRWWPQEIAYVDFVVDAFDSGMLKVEHGMTLSDFLSELLLCKSTRLTKKLKKANLCSRTYQWKQPLGKINAIRLSELQNSFLESIPAVAVRHEMRFHLARFWRRHFFDLCRQIQSNLLDATDWIASMDEMECRASAAEEYLRQARRKRRSSTFDKDGEQGNYALSIHASSDSADTKGTTDEGVALLMSGANAVVAIKRNTDVESSLLSDVADFEPTHLPLVDDDFTGIFNDIVHQADNAMSTQNVPVNYDCFLQEVLAYVEAQGLPFQHVDVWVPNVVGKSEGVSLLHAGHATRVGLDTSVFRNLKAFGKYSADFSFGSGQGFPGRVWALGEARWERHPHEVEPACLGRAAGAHQYGVKTWMGLSLSTAGMDRLVVCFYSTDDLPENTRIMRDCENDLAALCPVPKWKIVVGISRPGEQQRTSTGRLVEKSSLTDCESSPHTQSGSISSYSSGGSSSTANDAMRVHSSRFARMSSVSDTSLSCTSIEHETRIDQQLAGLLGDHMPLEQATGSYVAMSPPMTESFMSLRLLLLRDQDRRSSAEKDALEVIRKSYLGYRQDSQRSQEQVARLVSQDWQYLRSTIS